MNPLKSIKIGRKSQPKKEDKTKDLSESHSSKTSKGRRPRRSRSHELASSATSTSSSGSGKRGTRSRMGSHNQKHAPMHPTDLIALIEQRASVTGEMDSAAYMFELMKMGDTSGEFEPDSDTEA